MILSHDAIQAGWNFRKGQVSSLPALASRRRGQFAAFELTAAANTFLHRVVARLQLHGPRFTTTDFDDAVRLALSGLIQDSAA